MNGNKSLINVWSNASQWHEMFCHDPEVMSSNPSQVELTNLNKLLKKMGVTDD